MTPMAAYTEPRTDVPQPLPRYRGHEHLGLPAMGDPTASVHRMVFLLVDGIHQHHVYRARESERYTLILKNPASTARTEASSSLPPKVDETIAELVGLPEGWDGHDGLPVQPEVAERARRFMVAIREFTRLVPDIVPLPDGGLQLEWYVSTHEVIVEFPSDEAPHVYSERVADGLVEEFLLSPLLDITEVGPLFRKLRR